MFIRKYWIPLLVFIVAIAGVGIYLLTIQQPVELLEKQVEEPAAEVPAIGETQKKQQDEHLQADRTPLHKEPQTQETVPNVQSPRLSDNDIKELYHKLEAEGFKPENLSEKQLLHLRKVGLHWDYLSPQQQDEIVRNFWAQYGLNSPPDGYTYQLHSVGKPVLDEDGNAIISKIGNTSIKKSFGGYLLHVE